MKAFTFRLLAAVLVCGALFLASCSLRHDQTVAPALVEKSVAAQSAIERIVQRGRLIVGTTGDYRPLSSRESDTGEYWGFGIEVAERIAARLGLPAEFAPTSWPTLTAR